jgi:hypothetical protein
MGDPNHFESDMDNVQCPLCVPDTTLLAANVDCKYIFWRDYREVIE